MTKHEEDLLVRFAMNDVDYNPVHRNRIDVLRDLGYIKSSDDCYFEITKAGKARALLIFLRRVNQ